MRDIGMNGEIKTFRRITKPKGEGINKSEDSKKNLIIKYLKEFTKFDIMLLVIGFFISRAVIFAGFMPFGPSFFAATFRGRKSIAIGLVITLGLISAVFDMRMLKYVLSMTLFSGFYLLLPEKITRKDEAVAVLSGLCLFTISFIYISLNGGLLYDTVILAFETAACCIATLIFRKVVPLLGKKNVVFSTEQLMCIIALFGIILIGMSRLVNINGFSISNVLCVFLLLVISNKGGVTLSAASGVIMGIINSIGNLNGSYIIGVYGLCGLLSGIFAGFGKAGSVSAFIAGNALMTIYVNGSTDVLINIYETFAASVLFFSIPDKSLGFINKYIPARPSSAGKSTADRTKDLTAYKLYSIADSFMDLYDIFSGLIINKKRYDKSNVTYLLDQAAEQVCASCSLCGFCWQKEFQSTYHSMFSLFETLENNGHIRPENIPEGLKSRCIYIDTLISVICELFKIYKVDVTWADKIRESRELVCEQFCSVSKILENIGEELKDEIFFLPELEAGIEYELKKHDLLCSLINVVSNKEGKLEIDITVKSGKVPQDIEKIISEIVGEPVIATQTGRNMTFIKRPKYIIDIGVSNANKTGESISGDCFHSFITANKKQVVILSDGMGSGECAKKHSKSTINLLKTFLSAGFTGETAIRIINSMMMLRGGDEMFSSLDIAVFDLNYGYADFIKLGCANGFIKKDHTVEVIDASGLPIGMLSDVDIKVSRKWLSDGETVLMVSDGAFDPDPTNPEYNDYIPETLSKNKVLDPQAIAEMVIKRALKSARNSPKDDMTVVAAKIKQVS